MTGGVLGCFAAGLIAPGTLWRRVLVGAAFLVLYAAAYFWGLQSFRRAFNECVERGEEVRSLLREHYQRKDQYPERLNELERSLPCGRIARPTVLEYKKTKGGYVLTFRDWLVEHSASESSAFLASK